MVQNEDQRIPLFPAESEMEGPRLPLSRLPTSSSGLLKSIRATLFNCARERPSVRVSVYKVLHGTLANGRPGSLIVTDFYLEATQGRIVTAVIHYTFTTNKPAPSATPTVRDIAPSRYANIKRTEKDVELSFDATLDVGTSKFISMAKEWVLESRPLTVDKSILGSRIWWSSSAKKGEMDSARWVLVENSDQESGIPDYLRTAILVEREDEESNLLATIEVSMKLDIFSTMRKVEGFITFDNPIIFQPRKDSNWMPKGTDIESYGVKNLDGEDWKRAQSLARIAKLEILVHQGFPAKYVDPQSLEKLLQRVFPNKFKLEVRGNYYYMTAPRRLTSSEIDAIQIRDV